MSTADYNELSGDWMQVNARTKRVTGGRLGTEVKALTWDEICTCKLTSSKWEPAFCADVLVLMASLLLYRSDTQHCVQLHV